MMLLLCVLLPAVLGGVLLGMKRAGDGPLKAVAVAGAAIACALSLIAAFLPGEQAFALGVFQLKMDGPARALFALCGVLFPFAMLFAVDFMKRHERRRAFLALYACALGAVLLMGCAGSLIALWAGYAWLAAACVPLLGFSGGADGKKALRWGGVSLGIGLILSLAAVIGFLAGGRYAFAPGGYESAAAGNETLYVLLGILGFGALFGLLPLTGWTGKSTLAPAPASALLHALCGSAGVIAAARVLSFLAPGAALAAWLPTVLLLLGMGTACWGEIRMLRTPDVEMRMACSSVSNYAFMLMALCLMNGAGLAAALSHMVTHAAAKMILFICTGIILEETGRITAKDMHGLGRHLPWTFTCFTVAGLSLMGMPPLPGFVSKYALITAAFSSGDMWQRAGAFVMAISTVFTAADIFVVVFPAFCAEPELKNGEQLRDCGAAAKWALALLCLALTAMIFAMSAMTRDFAGMGGGAA